MNLTYEQQRDRRIIQRFGGGLTYALRKKNSLAKALTLSAAALAGASSITVTTPGNLRRNDGKVVKGATFTLAGVTGTCTVAADATVTGNPLTITFTPVLAGPAALGAALTWSQTYAEYTYAAMNGSSQEQTEEQMIAAGELVRWLLADSSLPAPETGDELGGLSVKRVFPVGPSATPSRYKVIVGAAS